MSQVHNGYPDLKTVYIDYTNHRGERRWRHVGPIGQHFQRTDHHPVQQWLLLAIDIERDVIRSFAFKNIHEWRDTAPAEYTPKESESKPHGLS